MSESFLSQEEVDALLEGVTGESQKTEQEVFESGEVRSYDISSQERIVRCSISFAAAPKYRWAWSPCSATARFCANWLCRPTSIS